MYVFNSIHTYKIVIQSNMQNRNNFSSYQFLYLTELGNIIKKICFCFNLVNYIIVFYFKVKFNNRKYLRI